VAECLAIGRHKNYKNTDASVLFIHGTRDEIYPPEKVRDYKLMLAIRSRTVQGRSYDAGHEITQEMRDDVRDGFPSEFEPGPANSITSSEWFEFYAYRFWFGHAGLGKLQFKPCGVRINSRIASIASSISELRRELMFIRQTLVIVIIVVLIALLRFRQSISGAEAGGLIPGDRDS